MAAVGDRFRQDKQAWLAVIIPVAEFAISSALA